MARLLAGSFFLKESAGQRRIASIARNIRAEVVNVEGHIRPRKGKRGTSYQIIWWEGGRQRSETVHGTRREAEARKAIILAELERGEVAGTSKETFGAFLLDWLENTKPNVRPKTHRFYSQMCRGHIIPALGNIRLSELQARHIQRFYTSLDGKLSPGGIGCIHRTMKAALNVAMKQKCISRYQNPMEGVTPPKTEGKEPVVLTPEQALKLLEQARVTNRESLYLAAILTGMRQGELLGLRWQDVDLDRGLIFVRQQATGAGKHTGFAPPKSRAGRRLVSMPDSLIESLKAAWEEEKKRRAKYGPTSPYDLVWCVPNGGPVSARNLDRQFKALLVKAGLPDMRFHDLRHTHATWLYLVNADPETRKKRLGHTDLATTGIYTHPNAVPEVDRKVAADIDKLINPGRFAQSEATPS